jgi:hypothetical protein
MRGHRPVHPHREVASTAPAGRIHPASTHGVEPSATHGIKPAATHSAHDKSSLEKKQIKSSEYDTCLRARRRARKHKDRHANVNCFTLAERRRSW